MTVYTTSLKVHIICTYSTKVYSNKKRRIKTVVQETIICTHTLLVGAYQGNAQNPHPNITIRVHVAKLVRQF